MSDPKQPSAGPQQETGAVPPAPSTPPVVVDASLALKWLMVEPDSDRATARLAEWTEAKTPLLAPELIVPELASALFKRMRRGDLALADGEAALESFLRLGVHLVSMMPLGGPALRLAHRFRLKAPYDAHYLALAEREGCELWTADERLWNAVQRELSWVRWIGEARPSPTPST